MVNLALEATRVFRRSGKRSSMRPLRFATLAFCLLAACYVYVPVESPAPEVGERVRVLIQADAARRISAEAGRPIRALEGLLVESGEDTVRVSELVARTPQGMPLQEFRQILSVASSEVIEYQRSQLSRRRTALVGLGVAALLGYAIFRLTSEGSSPGEEQDGFPDAPSVLPAFRIPLSGALVWPGGW